MESTTVKENLESNKIEIKNIFKSFGEKKVLNDINLSVKKNESLVIIGGSGTGKSVLIKIIMGLLNPDQGGVLIDGEDLCKTKDKNIMLRKMGMLFQGGALFDSMTILENVAFGLRQGQKKSIKEAHEIAYEKLNAVELNERVAHLYPSELSGGMQKRAALARAIATNPEIIFFDEPTTGLDPILSGTINNLMKKCVRELGATTITITHDMNSLRNIADNVALIHQGQILWTGSIHEMENSSNKALKQFISGSPNGPLTQS